MPMVLVHDKIGLIKEAPPSKITFKIAKRYKGQWKYDPRISS